MSMSSGQLEPRPASGEITPNQHETALVGLQSFETLILDILAKSGLPTSGILVGVEQRHVLMESTSFALMRLPVDQRGQASYISKMIIAGSVGLFDAALNYLWDETVLELRKRVVNFDLQYFYEVAEKSDNKRKDLKDEDDLPKLDDQKLLGGCREIGLISDIGFQELDLIRYMRNWASAAHPNQVELDGLQLANWLSTCIRHVITLPYDHITAQVQKLLVKVKEKRLDDQAIREITAFFVNLPPVQADPLASGLFGRYTDLTTGPETLDNIRRLWPELWQKVSDETRYNFGFRLGRFRANGDQDQAVLARQLIDLVAGATYLPSEERAWELDGALNDLIDAHNGWSNFYTEPPIARRLQELVGQHGDIPEGLTRKYVLGLVEVFLTNGNGIAHNADSIYRDLITRFNPQQASVALRSFTDSAIASKLQQKRPQEQWTELLGLIESKLTARNDRELLEAIRAFPSKPNLLARDPGIKVQLKHFSG
ncbi:hypothetical protein OG906_41360 (plasmid) [Streptomyces sp. NBC_01426]|uniref:hypothetical protein n=1 Tax=Streptomyces sp. NBC_01426 TaxID=2975866 RepID=UPI002E361772|nr:hypothetical protein [Streptomyces sp. NBC_01426]